MKVKKSLLWLLQGIILIVIGFFVGKLLESYTHEVEISIQNKILDGKYVPINIENVGGQTLTNIVVEVTGCGLCNNTWSYLIPQLVPNEDYIVEYDCPDLINEFKIMDCSSHNINMSLMRGEL